MIAAIPCFGAAPAASGQSAPIPPGYRPHVYTTAGGSIDWARGEIVAEGIGRAKSGRDQDRRMAERAAEVVAARNAALMALGLFMDRSNMLRDMKDGEVHLEAMLAGHEVTSLKWEDAANPPVCSVQLRLPMWGVKSVASLVFEQQRTWARASARMPLAPPRIGEPEADEVLIIDARGLNLLPCMFPIVVNSDGRVLYNFAGRSQVHGDILPVLHYVEVDPAAMAAAPKTESNEDMKSEDRATTRPADRASPGLAELPVGRNQIHVRAMKAGGTTRADIVLRRDDCKRLADSAQVTRLLKYGRVLVVVDPLPSDASLPRQRER